jgi:hypothetical protein
LVRLNAHAVTVPKRESKRPRARLAPRRGLADHPVLPLRCEEENEMPDERRVPPGRPFRVTLLTGPMLNALHVTRQSAPRCAACRRP